jgi:hypothetical protein
MLAAARGDLLDFYAPSLLYADGRPATRITQIIFPPLRLPVPSFVRRKSHEPLKISVRSVFDTVQNGANLRLPNWPPAADFRWQHENTAAKRGAQNAIWMEQNVKER